MERIPILKMGSFLLVTIQVDMHDQLAMTLQDDLTARVVPFVVSFAAVRRRPKRFAAPLFPLVTATAEQARTLGYRFGKRVGFTPSRVRISYPPPA